VSDIDGRDAFDNVLDRLVDMAGDRRVGSEKLNAVEWELRQARDEIKRLERDLAEERARPKAPGTASPFSADTPVVPRPAGADDIPF
jgi:hypothetical protein